MSGSVPLPPLADWVTPTDKRAVLFSFADDIAANDAAYFTGSCSGTTLTVVSVESGAIAPGQYLSDGSKIIAYGSGEGGPGTYQLNVDSTLTGILIATAQITAQSVSVRPVGLQITANTISWDGQGVVVQTSGGNAGTNYSLSVTVTMSTGSVLTRTAVISCVAQRG